VTLGPKLSLDVLELWRKVKWREMESKASSRETVSS
jgi:hypothetical protein